MHGNSSARPCCRCESFYAGRGILLLLCLLSLWIVLCRQGDTAVVVSTVAVDRSIELLSAGCLILHFPVSVSGEDFNLQNPFL